MTHNLTHTHTLALLEAARDIFLHPPTEAGSHAKMPIYLFSIQNFMIPFGLRFDYSSIYFSNF